MGWEAEGDHCSLKSDLGFLFNDGKEFFMRTRDKMLIFLIKAISMEKGKEANVLTKIRVTHWQIKKLRLVKQFDVIDRNFHEDLD
jgi:hypothetical protein